MARERTFIAVELTERIREACLDLQRELPRNSGSVKWVTEENFHVTLLFLGEVDVIDLVKICRVVQKRAAKVKPFRLTVGGLGCFPTPRRPKVLWAGVTEGAEKLAKLHAGLEEPLMELGCYRREERNYNPHLTLGRIASSLEGDSETDENRITGTTEAEFSWAQYVKDHEAWQAGYCEIEEVVVMTSEHRRKGPLYTVAARCPLGNRDKSD